MENVHFESLYPDTARFAEIEKLLAFVKEGNSCQLVSLPGVGRSTIFRLLAYNRAIRIKHLGENQKWFHFVIVNFSEVRNQPLFAATKLLFLSLIESLRERKLEKEYKKVDAILKEVLDRNDELVLFQGLKKAIDFLAIEKELTIVFLFDRLEEYIPQISPQFFTNLQALRNIAKYRFSVVFSLSRPLEDLLEPSFFTDFYEFVSGHTIYLSLFDTPGTDFRIAYLEKVCGKTVDKKLLDEILKITAGHGKLTKLCVEAILNNETIEQWNNVTLTTFLLEQKPVLAGLYEIWQSLMPHEQQFITNVILNKLSVIPSAVEESRHDNQHLENIYLMQDDKITIPLFTEFVKQHSQSTMKQFNNGTIVFDPTTNQIKKGAVVISDTLTSAEFKLLRFLLQNQDRIIEREDIIHAVWPESKNAQGVSDQAIDQLIFRLRHKIEDDPNTPKHLETIKGRGFRFLP